VQVAAGAGGDGGPDEGQDRQHQQTPPQGPHNHRCSVL